MWNPYGVPPIPSRVPRSGGKHVHFTDPQDNQQAPAPRGSAVHSLKKRGHGSSQYQDAPPMAQSWIPHHDTGPMQPVASTRQQDIVGPGSMKPNYSVVPYQPGFPHINPPYTQNQETFSQTRYLTFTRHTIPPAFISCLKKIFKVQRSKVKDWVVGGLIRADMQSLWEGTMWLDIRPLWAQLARRDKERWNAFVGEFREAEEFKVREAGNEREWARAFGLRRDFFMEFVQSGLPYGLPPPAPKLISPPKETFHHDHSHHPREDYEECW